MKPQYDLNITIPKKRQVNLFFDFAKTCLDVSVAYNINQKALPSFLLLWIAKWQTQFWYAFEQLW